MRHSPIFGMVILLFFLLSCHIAFGQSPQAPIHDGQTSDSGKTTTDLPLERLNFRPKLSLQNALKIAEGYIAKVPIDISSYWLYEVRFILYGDATTADKDKIPGWFFWWHNDDGIIGKYIEIFVSMDGKAMRLPSM